MARRRGARVRAPAEYRLPQPRQPLPPFGLLILRRSHATASIRRQLLFRVGQIRGHMPKIAYPPTLAFYTYIKYNKPMLKAPQSSLVVLASIPTGAIIAHYAALPSGGYAVVTPSGQVLAPSFYALRNSHSPVMVIQGAGCWVVLQPKIIQPALF